MRNAAHGRQQGLTVSAREKFHAPLLQSVVDSVVFGRDLDFSGSQDYDDAFKACQPWSRGMEIIETHGATFGCTGKIPRRLWKAFMVCGRA